MDRKLAIKLKNILSVKVFTVKYVFLSASGADLMSSCCIFLVCNKHVSSCHA